MSATFITASRNRGGAVAAASASTAKSGDNSPSAVIRADLASVMQAGLVDLDCQDAGDFLLHYGKSNRE